MVSTAQALQHLYPDSVALRDWVVTSSGGVETVAFWSDALGTQPSAQTIEAAKLPAAKAQRITTINAECRARLVARFGDALEQNSRAVGAYGDAEQAALKPGIEAMIDASNTASNAVLAAADIAEVEAVSVSWPAI